MIKLNIATISPSKIASGMLALMKNLCLLILFIVMGTPLFSRNAPITIATNIGLCQIGLIAVPVTVVNFIDVSSISLRIEYDPTVMTYSSFVANDQLGTMIVNDVPVSANLHKIMIVWGETAPRTFTDGSTLITLLFTYFSGTTPLIFNNTANGGGDCEYADENGNSMNDTPTATYYMNSMIQTVPAQISLTNINISNGHTATYKATQTINLAGNGSFFTVQNGGSTVMVSGQRIQFFPGATVQSGAYLHALITDPCIFPNIPQNKYTSCVGIDRLSDEAKPQTTFVPSMFTVYPNPTNDKFNLEIVAQNMDDMFTVELYGMFGEKVQTEILIGQRKHAFSLSNRPIGIYFISVKSGDQTEALKIIKK